MRKFSMFVLTMCMVASFLFVPGCGDDDKNLLDSGGFLGENSLTVVSGIQGVNSQEGYENLFDGDTNTKWCVTEFSSAYVICEFENPVEINGYTIVTGNDNSIYPGRNPSSWALYGMNSSSVPDENDSGWEIIDEVNDDSVLQDTDFTPFHFDVDYNDSEYNYYMLVINKTKGAPAMQISEFALEYPGANVDFNNPNEPSPEPNHNPDSFFGDGNRPNIGGDDKCFHCNGSGKITCTTCGGKGYYDITTSTPGYSGSSHRSTSTTRKKCNSLRCVNGQKDCNYCGGDGRK